MATFHSTTDSRNYRLSLTITESSQNIANNQTTISYSLVLHTLSSFFFQDFASTITLTIDGVSLLNTTTQRVSLPSGNSATLLTSGTMVINHNTDGTKSLPFSASFRTNSTTTFTPIPTHTISDSQALTTIPRASQPTLNVSTQVMGSAITISTNRASTAFTHTLKFVFGNQSGTVATGVGDSTSWTLPLSLANAIPNATSGSGSITCETYNGSTLIGTRTVTFTATVPTSIVPTVSISHSATPSYQNLYIATVTSSLVVLSALGSHGSTIVSRSTTVSAGGNTISTSTANSFTSAVIQVSGTITITSTVTDSRGRTGTSTVTFTSNAYPSPTLNVSTQALGGAITINTNRLHTSFTHTLKHTFGNQSGTIATGVGASQAWTLPNSLANAIPNGTSGSGTITCETYNGSTLIGTRTVAFTATVPNNATFQPNASISSITEGQSGLTTFSVFIQNISRLRVQSTGSGNFGATISQQRVTIDGGHLFGANVTFNPINRNGTLTVTLLVTDSRGYSRTVTQNVTLVAYFAPRINSFSASRSPNDQGTDLSAPINFEIAPVSNQNTRLYRVRYRVSGGSWVLLFESRDFYSRVFTHTATGILNTNSSYEIELFVQDSFTSVTQVVTVTTAFDLLNFNQSGRGLAIGKVSEGDVFEVDLPSRMRKGIAFIDSRSLLDEPQDLPRNAISFDFKLFTSVGNPSVNAGNGFCHILTVAGWNTNEGSGGWPTQLSVGEGIAFRRAINATTWNTWNSFWHTGNFNPASYSLTTHTHAIAGVTGLQTALDARSLTTHTHAIAGVTGLQTALDGRAPSVHTHAIASITGLQTALDGRSLTGHTHSELLPLTGGTMTGTIIGRNNTSEGIAVGNRGNPSFEVISNSTAAAFITFHRSSNWAVRFGLDTDNVLKIGGWSMGNVAHTIWHSGNLSGSSREIKKDIEQTNHQVNYEVFKGLKVHDYNLIDESDEKKTRSKDHIGLITDEVPDFLTDKEQSHIKLYDLLSLTVSTLQTTINKVEELEIKVDELQKIIDGLKLGGI